MRFQAMVPHTTSSVDCFMWHPQSMPITEVDGAMVLTLNDCFVLTHADGSLGVTAKEMGMSAEIPPRTQLVSSTTGGYSLWEEIGRWTSSHKMIVLHSNHAVVDLALKVSDHSMKTNSMSSTLNPKP
jgi:hypothetical protein